MSKEESLVFRIQPRLLRHLGEQLIRDSSLAVFELVKNAYDADATACQVTLETAEAPKGARIIVEDDGDGMTSEIIRDVWMVIATDHRAKQREKGQRTSKYHRYPLGEKGLGRLAVHKLGDHIKIVTRAEAGPEVVLEFDWSKLESAADLKKAAVALISRDAKVFAGDKHGTRIVVSGLREKWTRGDVRDLQREVTSLCSPFKAPGEFKVNLELKPDNGWLEGLLDAKEVRKCALYHVRGWLEDSTLEFDYTFTPPRGTRDQLVMRKERTLTFPLQHKEDGKWRPLDLSVHKIGRVEFDFYIFDRDPEVVRAVTDDIEGLRTYLNENGGMRIYREGVRVFDFGEPGNDWLNLDGRRVNKPVARVSNNQILGVLLLNAESSSDLIEKSNREGFLENAAYNDFQDAVISVLTQVEAERKKDQKLVRHFYSRGGPHKSVFDSLGELRETLERRGMPPEIETKLTRVEKQLETYRETMLRAAVPGLSFGVLLHGAEKLLRELVSVSHSSDDLPRIRKLVDQLDKTVGRLGNLMRGSGSREEDAKFLIQQAFFNVEFRLQRHEIAAVSGMKLGNPDFQVRCTRRLIIATLNNLLDNSIYWLQFAKPGVERKIFLGTSKDLKGGPAIVVADTGPGFQDEPDVLVQPFFSRRPDGMGLGLYLSDDVMRLHEGRLLFPAFGDVDLPKEFKGAILALQFPKVS